MRLGRGDGGLLDEIELPEAERWLQAPTPTRWASTQRCPSWWCAAARRSSRPKQEKEAARQRELAQAQALAEEQQRRAEEQAAASQRLRRRAVVLAALLVVAVVAIGAAFMVWLQVAAQSASCAGADPPPHARAEANWRHNPQQAAADKFPNQPAPRRGGNQCHAHRRRDRQRGRQASIL